MRNIKNIDELSIAEKRVFLRLDLNVPLNDENRVADDTRILASLPTIEYALKQNAAVMVCSHLGRPVEGIYDEKYSLSPVRNYLEVCLGRKIKLIRNWFGGLVNIKPGELVILENARFVKGEASNDPEVAKTLSGMFDVYINDAFATAHRKEMTIHQLPMKSSIKGCGFLFKKEIDSLREVLGSSRNQTLAIIGGAKVSTKLELFNVLSEKVKCIIAGGGLANTFLKAKGHEIGNSMYEEMFIDSAKKIIEKAKSLNTKLILPTDVRVSSDITQEVNSRIVKLNHISVDDVILDFGPETMKIISKEINEANKILWNGPLGVFEKDAFSYGTRSLAELIKDAPGYTIAGGGDTIAAINKFIDVDMLDYVSTGGGAFMEFFEKNGNIPAIEALNPEFSS